MQLSTKPYDFKNWIAYHHARIKRIGRKRYCAYSPERQAQERLKSHNAWYLQQPGVRMRIGVEAYKDHISCSFSSVPAEILYVLLEKAKESFESEEKDQEFCQFWQEQKDALTRRRKKPSYGLKPEVIQAIQDNNER